MLQCLPCLAEKGMKKMVKQQQQKRKGKGKGKGKGE